MRITIQHKVIEILSNKKETRDNDFYVLYWIWKDEFDKLKCTKEHKLDFDKTSIINILSLLKSKDLTHPSAIMRARRKVQEMDPGLRGQLWAARHKEEEKVQADLGYAQSQNTGDQSL
jgi:hypothetical protein